MMYYIYFLIYLNITIRNIYFSISDLVFFVTENDENNQCNAKRN